VVYPGEHVFPIEAEITAWPLKKAASLPAEIDQLIQMMRVRFLHQALLP
jgi:hypothetical protein